VELRMPNPRFREDGQPRWWAPDNRTLVRCPKCEHLAVVAVAGESDVRHARVTCESCGYARSSRLDRAGWQGPARVRVWGYCRACGRGYDESSLRPQPPKRRTASRHCLSCRTPIRVRYEVSSANPRVGKVDDYFGLPLWLQASCRGEVLWAQNEAHLTVLENYVGAFLREREPNMNASHASRLPSWIKQAKHRGAILECIGGLRRSLVRTGPPAV
jgi:hypothetical protein